MAKHFVLVTLVLTLVLAGCRTPTVEVIPTPRPPVRLAIPLKSVTPEPTAKPLVTPTIGSGRVPLEIHDNYFEPQTITVTVGSTLTWRHLGNVAHDITGGDRAWGGSLITSGGAWQLTFGREGVYDYYCSIHQPSMRGRIVVVK